MAKTIHDVAIACGKEHQGTVDIEVFEVGANAVLAEIEKCLDEKYAITSFYRVKDRIKQLKGEIK